ncbi:MAG TPA: serpin family protein, partial [Chlamydiales bacterium]|nr:serpin family protein [Chlamydiales bacterium]
LTQFLSSLVLSCFVATAFSEVPVDNFSSKLSQQLLSEDNGNKNLFFSPYSAKIALQMALDGASGKTFDEMKAALGSDVPHFFSTGIASFQAMAIASNYSPNKSYLDEVQKKFQAKVLSVDFAKHKDEAIAMVNHWVVTATDGRIAELLSPQDVNQYTKLILLNAVSFKQPWASSFSIERTKKAPFKTAAGRELQVEMMNKEDYFPYAEDINACYLELDFQEGRKEKLEDEQNEYKNEPKYSCLIVLPKDQDALEALQKGFTYKTFTDWRALLRDEYVDFFLPKVTIDWKDDLKNELKNLGIDDAFDPKKADFSRLSSKNDLYIGKVIHGARLRLDERGLEAQAATAVSMMMKTMAPPQYKIIMQCDHPFLLFVFEKKSGDILFVGRVSTP